MSSSANVMCENVDTEIVLVVVSDWDPRKRYQASSKR